MIRSLSPAFCLALIALTISLAACTKPAGDASAASDGAIIATQKAGNLTITLSNGKGHFSEGENDFTLTFRNAGNQPVDVGAITMTVEMPAMGSMPLMKSDAKIVTTNTPGVYQGHLKLDMGGTWQVHIKYKGQAGEGQADFSINAK